MRRRTAYPRARDVVAGLSTKTQEHTPSGGCLHEPLEPRVLLQGGPVLSVAAVDAQASEEGPDPGVFRFTLDAAAATDIAANFRLGGTARRGVDYDLLVNGNLLEGTSVTIPAGQTSLDVVMMPIDDALLELTEQVVLALRKGADYTLPPQRAPRLARIDLEDNEPFVLIEAVDGLASEDGDTAVFRIARDGSLAHDLPVGLRIGGSARLNRDFHLVVDGAVLDSRTIILPAGERFVDVVVVPLDDPFTERTESIVLAPARSRFFAVAPAVGVASVDLLDNEPTLALSSFGTADEDGRSPSVFRITRDSAFDSDLFVPFHLRGSATFGRDFDLLVGDEILDTRGVVIPAGDPFVDVVVRPIDDAFVERTEFVGLGLRGSRTFRLPTSRDLRFARTELLDDEPELTVATLDATTGAFGATVVRVRRDGDFDEAFTTPLQTGGSARFNRDFQFTIPAGDPFVDVVVVPTEDELLDDGRLDIVRFGLPRSRAFTTDPALRVVDLTF